MKPLRISSITKYIRTYGALYALDMNAIMFYYFLPQRYERDYLILIKVWKDFKHASTHAIYATHLSHKLGNHLEAKYSTPHFTAVITPLYLVYKLEWGAIRITLKHSTHTLKVIK